MAFSTRGNMKRFKTLSLGSHSIQIVYKKTVLSPDGAPVLGISEFLHNTIEISTEFQGKKLAEEVITHTLFHEIVHFILHLMNCNELNENEAFVDQVGGHIAQVMKTLK